MKTRKRSPLSPHMLSLFTTTPGKAGSSSPTRGGREEKRSAHSGYAPSASPGLSWGGRPQPIEVSASVALSPAGAGRASGLSQWAIGMNSPPNMENAGGSGAKPPEPVLSSHKSQAASDGRLQKALAMLADSDRLMPWVKRMEIGPGLIFTGFVDEHGVPDVFGYIKYYGHDDDVVLNAIPQAHRLHVSTHYECSFGATHSKRQLRHTARHDIRPVSSLPSVVTNIVHRQAIATKQVLAVFIGEIRKGHRHGLGRIKFHSGREYAGQWDQDQAQGVGVERRADKSKYYGHLARWRRHGYGLSIQGHQEGGSGYATTEGLFTDGREDLCTVRGYMQADRFQVTRRDFVSMHFDCIISSEAFDPCVREHMDLVGEADAAFQRAVEAERGANVIVNLVLHLDDTCTRFIKTGEPVPSAHADPARAHNFCSRSYEESSLLKDVWVDTLAAGSYTELVYGSLLSHLRRAAASSFDTHAPGSLFQSEASEANSLPARHDLPNVNSDIDLRLQLCLRENFEIISSTRAGLMAFERNLCREIATAVGIPLDRFAILATGPSDASVAVLLLILADALGPAPAVIGERLTAQLSFAGSSLRNGSLSRKVFRCTPYERRVTERCSNSQYPHIKAHLSQTTLFPWHIDHFGSVANDVPVVSIFDSTFRRQSFDGRRPAGSNASNVPTKYQFQPRSAFGRAFSELDSPSKSIMSLSPRKSVKIVEEDPSAEDVHGEHETWAEKAHKRLSPPAARSQSSQEEASLLLSIEQKRKVLKRIMASSKHAEGKSTKAAYNPVSPLQSPHPRPGNRRDDKASSAPTVSATLTGDAWSLDGNFTHGQQSGHVKNIETEMRRVPVERGSSLQRIPRSDSTASLSSTSSRRRHQATPEALDEQGTARTVYMSSAGDELALAQPEHGMVQGEEEDRPMAGQIMDDEVTSASRPGVIAGFLRGTRGTGLFS